MFQKDLFHSEFVVGAIALYFGVVGFPFLDGDVPRSASCGFCISQLIRFAGMSSWEAAGFRVRSQS